MREFYLSLKEFGQWERKLTPRIEGVRVLFGGDLGLVI